MAKMTQEAATALAANLLEGIARTAMAYGQLKAAQAAAAAAGTPDDIPEEAVTAARQWEREQAAITAASLGIVASPAELAAKAGANG